MSHGAALPEPEGAEGSAAADGTQRADAAVEAEPVETGTVETGPAETGPAETGPAETEPAEWAGPLPEPVRLRVVAIASETLAELPDDDVPASLRPFRRWTPARRTKLAATPLAAAVERDVVFRQRAATRVRTTLPNLSAGLDNGAVPPAADPVEVAAAAYLLRTPGWGGLVAAAAEHVTRAHEARESSATAQAVAELQQALAEQRERARQEVAQARSEADAARAEAESVARALREEKGARRRAERAAAEAQEQAAAEVAAAQGVSAAAEVELRRVRARLAEAEAAVEAARRASREGRSVEGTRLRLLLDTIVESAQGLRRELALPPVTDRPADLVEAAGPADTTGPAAGGAWLTDDPAVLDQLLSLPQVHLVVDGYNVTKTGYPDLPLDQQRTRLVGGLVALAARSGAEVTCCFDGATVAGRVPSMSGRGVRVLFSKPDEIADELIRRLVRAEPPGRAVVVVSSDREVADAVRRMGARAVTAAALVRRLDRG